MSLQIVVVMSFLFKLLAFFFVAEFTVLFAQGQENAFNSVCNLGLVDAATVTKDGSTYFFQGLYYWKYIDGGVEYGYPKLISECWEGVRKGPIDAAFTWDDGSTFIFQKNHYWRFVNKVPEPGYPQIIQDGFGDIPSHLDAAVTWDDHLTYFFKGDQYWRFVPDVIDPLRGDYPKSISQYWQGVPSNITAALRWDDKTYFFQGSNYFRYDSDLFVVPYDYPKPTTDWYQCDVIDARINYKYEKYLPKPVKTTISDVYKQSENILNMLTQVNQQQSVIATSVQLLEEYDIASLIQKTEDAVSSTSSTIIVDEVIV